MMKPMTVSRVVTYLLHVLFWIVYGSIFYSSQSVWINSEIFLRNAVVSEVATSSTISYVNLLLLLPRLYSKGKYSLYIAASISCVIALVFIRVNVLPAGVTHASMVYSYFIRSVPIVGFYLLTTVIWFFNNLMSARRKEVELQNSQLDSELKFLKLQLSPHFLFNNLHNIYSMSYLKDPNTPEAILKLSGMIRYMIYEDQGKVIELTKEIEFIENFIELQRLKLDKKTSIIFTHLGINPGQKIAPMIFLVFLENAFKHGNTINGSILIHLSVTHNKVLDFRIKNDIHDKPNTQDEKSGVGLANARKRLELIYPGKHTLTLTSEATYFEVNLMIELE